MATIETGNIIPRFAFWNPSTWAIPELYWDTFSQEQRIHAICKQLGKVIAYADYLGVNVDDIASRLKAIEDGQLNEYIIDAIEAWFDENEPAIVSAIEQLESDVDALEDILPKSEFTSVNTVKKYVDDEIASEASTRSDDITALADKIPASAFTSTNTVKKYVDDAVTEINGDISDLFDAGASIIGDYAVFIGDSYLRGTGSTEGPEGGNGYGDIGNGWGRYLLTRVRMNVDKVMCIGAGSSGFVSLGTNGGGVGLNFSGMVEKASSLMTDDEKSRCRYVIVCGGINDGSNITLASVTSTIDIIRSDFPKVPIHVFTNIGTNSVMRGLATGQAIAYATMKQACAISGAAFHEMWPLMLNAPGTVINEDGIHPTTNGYRYFARAMEACINGGEIGSRWMPQGGFINQTAESGVTFSYPLMYDGLKHVTLQGNISLSSDFDVDSSTPAVIGSIPSLLSPKTTTTLTCMVSYEIDDSGNNSHVCLSPIIVEILGQTVSNTGNIRVRRPLGFAAYTGIAPTNYSQPILKGATIYLPITEWTLF